MKGPHAMTLRPLLALSMMAALSGCLSFGGKPPKQVLSLTPERRVVAGATMNAASGASITVLDPETPKKLDTVRIPVQVDDTSVAYVTKTQWVDTPRHLFQKLLSETISAGGSVLVLEPGQYSVSPGKRLLGEIVDFGIDARSRSAIVTFDALLAEPGGAAISKKRFSASVPVPDIDAESIGAPLNQAANKVAADIAAWVAAGGT